MYAGVSEMRQESVVLCAKRWWRRRAGWTVDGGVVSASESDAGGSGRVRGCAGARVRLVKAYKGARRAS